MNKKVIILIVALLLILLGAGAAIMLKSKNSEDITDNFPVSDTASSAPKTLKELLGLGISQKCTFDKGQVFIIDGKVRGNFEGNSHMIIDGGTSYIWTDDQKNGIKTTFDINASPPGSPEVENENPGQFDYNESINYVCEPWAIDSSAFEIPNDVTFQDVSLFTNPSGSSATQSGNSNSQCGYCDSLTGENKTQCLSAFNCN